MNEEQLRIFLEAADSGNFTKVAKKHYLSQRSVSMRMKRLENQLGVTLFIRHSNRLELTDAGHLFYKRIHYLVGYLDETYNLLSRLQKQEDRQINFGFFSKYDGMFVQKAIKKFPNINFNTKKESTEHLIRDVQIDNLDCAIINNGQGFNFDFEKLGLSSLIISSDEIMMKCSINLINKQTKYFPVKLFEKYPIVYYGNDKSNYFKKAFFSSLGSQRNITMYQVNSFDQMQMLVASGKAISFCPSSMVNFETKTGIKYLPIKNNSNWKFNFTLIYQRNNHKQSLEQIKHYYRKICKYKCC